MRGAPATLPPPHTWRPLLRLAIEEDLGPGDATTLLVVETGRRGVARIEARQPLVVCGMPVAEAVFQELDPGVEVRVERSDGQHAAAGEVLTRISGDLRALLAAERTALNFLGRLCGVATFTRRFVDAVADTGAQIVDTRKTLPGWRLLDKYAAAVGGAVNHRVGLFDGILLKDNHVALCGGVAAAVKAARAAAPAGLRIQIEVESEADALAAVEAGADFLLLDNRTPDELERIVRSVGARALLEASGGVSLENVRRIAATGVQRISIGALTHSAPVADVALEIDDGRDRSGSARGGRAGGAAR